jgi:hypothetical protein
MPGRKSEVNTMRSVLIFLVTVLFSPALCAAAFILADDENILYTGRWDDSNPIEPWAYAKGTSVIAEFSGTGLSASISATTTDYLRVIIDDDAVNSVKIPISYGTASYTLETGLTGPSHKVEIVKETDAGRWAFHGFELDDGAGLDSPPARPARKLVFYGDSNLAGYSLEHEQNQADRSLRGTYYGYAGITSRMFGAEYSNISRSGATIRSLHASFDRIDWNSRGTTWDFSKFQPDAVVINIGANDVGRPVAKMKKDYHALLDDMRIAYPDAHIVLYNAWGWDYDEPANFIHEVIEERGDPNMSWAIFPWLFEQWHGCEYDHGGMAHVLAEHLQSELEWSPEPADVMSGYGVAGDVANGGFEEEAPFGGYGWRYYTDAGVERRSDDTAHGGDYYLRLSSGAASHQPNPALPGETVTVTAWYRTQESDDEVHVTIDFRDQEMWTAPLDSWSETSGKPCVEIEGWCQLTMSATAPSGTANPVFHTRLTFQAGSGSTVDIDDVVMSADGGGGGGEICAEKGESCISSNDCCAGSCSKGKPSTRICL